MNAHPRPSAVVEWYAKGKTKEEWKFLFLSLLTFSITHTLHAQSSYMLFMHTEGKVAIAQKKRMMKFIIRVCKVRQKDAAFGNRIRRIRKKCGTKSSQILSLLSHLHITLTWKCGLIDDDVTCMSVSYGFFKSDQRISHASNRCYQKIMQYKAWVTESAIQTKAIAGVYRRVSSYLLQSAN